MKLKYLLLLILTLLLCGAPQVDARGIQFVGRSSSSAGTGATYAVALNALVGGINTAPQEGDLVIILTNVTGTTDLDIAAPTGYTEIADLLGNDTRDTNHHVSYKFMTSSPDTTVTVTGSGAAANGGSTLISVWRGVDKGQFMDVASTTANSTNGNLADAASITPATSGAVVLALVTGTGDTTPVSNVAPPGDFGIASTTYGHGTTMSGYVGFTAWYMHQAAATNTIAWAAGETSTSDSWAATTIALRPQSPNSPLYQAAGTAVAATTGTLTVAWPTHAVNDVALLFVESEANEATLSIANAFKKIGTTVSATGTRLDVFWARATSTTMGSPVAAANSDHAYGIILTFRNVFLNGNPHSYSSSDVKNAASVTDTLPAIPTEEEGQIIVLVATSDADSASAFTSAIVNNSIRGITERQDAGTANGNGGGLAIATALEESATSTINTTAFTVTSSASAMMTIALKGLGYTTTSTSATQNRSLFNGGRLRFIGGRLLFK